MGDQHRDQYKQLKLPGGGGHIPKVDHPAASNQALRNMPEDNRGFTKVRIWQQNVRKSLVAIHALLNGLKDEYDLVCIQEPHFDFRGITRAMGVWTVVYPSNHAEGQEGVTRLLILILLGFRQVPGPKSRWQAETSQRYG